MTFSTSKDSLFCDRGAEVGHDIVLKGRKVEFMAPAGYHCQDPSPEQAFHYDLHRMAKGQDRTMALIKDAHEKEGGIARIWALRGSERCNDIPHNKMNYCDKEFIDLFEKVYKEKTYYLT